MTTGAKLTARADGLLQAHDAVTFPFMAPRLQGQWRPDGRLDLALWGSGDLVTLRLPRETGEVVFGPNLLRSEHVAFCAAQSAPALLISGGRLLALTPARRRASWDFTPHPAATLETGKGGRIRLDLGWAVLFVEVRGDDLIVAAGATEAEALTGLALSADEICSEAETHAARCDQLPGADPVLRSMVQQGAHTALASVRRDARGVFSGLAAGLAYSAPARTYFRDGYWTAQILLKLDPDAVRRQIDLLSDVVQDDGEAPSGVIVEADRAFSWEVTGVRQAGAHRRRLDWWSDHFDSPLLFVLLIGDYLAATGDAGPVERHWDEVRAILARYDRFCGPGNLPLKPHHDRDWADNVYRSGPVAYNLGLWVGALRAAAAMGAALDPEFARECLWQVEQAQGEIDGALWQGRWHADYHPADGGPEAHLAIDSLTLLRYGGCSEERAAVVLEAARTGLESRNNPAQPWGDWGVMCAFPPYGRREHLRAKSAFAYRYHNGADWPWLDGLYAGERLRRGLSGWRYPLTRWWEVSLEKGWAGPVEYYSPPFARGGLLQGWSSLPAAVALAHADRVLTDDG